MTDVPLKPMAPRVCDTHSNGYKVTYRSPQFEGRSPVIGYFVKYKTPDYLWMSVNKHLITDTSLRVGELRPCTQYEFRVAAVNVYGIGKFSPASVPITTDSNKPSRPSCLVIKSDGRSVDVEWTMPCSESESTNFHYIILIHYRSPVTDGRMFVVTERKAGPVVRHSLSVELQREIFYDFAVAAVNVAGVGPYSATSERLRFLFGQLFSFTLYISFIF